MIKAKGTILKSKLKDNKELNKLMATTMSSRIQDHHKPMKNDLNEDYAALCSSSLVDQASEYPFGDKLDKDITDANRLTKKVCPYSSSMQSNYNKRD